MKIMEYGQYQLIFADGYQYEIEGEVGYKNAPWSKVSPNRVYCARLNNGKIIADIIDPLQAFSGKIVKCEKWDPELHAQVERFVMMEAIKQIVNLPSITPSKIIMHQDAFKDIKDWANEDN